MKRHGENGGAGGGGRKKKNYFDTSRELKTTCAEESNGCERRGKGRVRGRREEPSLLSTRCSCVLLYIEDKNL